MSDFPRRLDVFPTLTDGEPAARPEDVLSRVYDSIESIEAHAATAVLSGGDLSVDGALNAPGPGRTACLLQASVTLQSTQGGLRGIIVPWVDLFSESPLSLSLPTACPSGQRPAFNSRLTTVSLPIVFRTQDPCLVSAYRRLTRSPIAAGFVPGADAAAYVSLCVSDGGPAFTAGERVDLSLLFVGGTKTPAHS